MLKSINIFALLFSLAFLTANAQKLEMVKFYNDPHWDLRAMDVEHVADGYILVGYAYKENQGNYFMLKADKTGAKQWMKRGRDNADNSASSIIRMKDGGIFVAGDKMQPSAGTTDIFIFKTTGDSNIVWENHYGTDSYDWANNIKESHDGKLMITGELSKAAGQSDMLFMKVDKEGKAAFTKSFDITNDDVGTNIDHCSDGSYIICGTIWNKEYKKYTGAMVKVNILGMKLWERTFELTQMDKPTNIHETSDGGFIIGGTYNGGVALIKTDAEGDIVWERYITEASGGCVFLECPDGGFLIGSGAGLVLKTDNDGMVQWKKRPNNIDGTMYYTGIKQVDQHKFVLSGVLKGKEQGSKAVLVVVNEQVE